MSTDERTVRTSDQRSRRSRERTDRTSDLSWLPSVTRSSPERRAEIAAAVRSGALVRARQGVYVRPPDQFSSPAGAAAKPW
ncbi:hypothetical protein BJF88_05805 [Cellulosimicrobium sp. CUA-896]|nr:hypothetical protein BJF88_05805 [Cellulosimicrobium sp. CUA-896]